MSFILPQSSAMCIEAHLQALATASFLTAIMQRKKKEIQKRKLPFLFKIETTK